MATKKVVFDIEEKGASKVAAGTKKIDSGFAKAAKSAALYAAAYIGVRGIISVTKQAIEAFGIQEQAEKKLAVALGHTSQALLDQAAALQQVSTYGDETIISVQASIAAFTKNEEEIKKATSATLDFAAAMGFDLKSAGDLVGKTLGSSTNALTRYGVEVTGAVGSNERLTTLTEGITKLWGGQASAAADTMAGSITQAQNAMGDLSETMATFLAPDIIGISGWFKEIADNLNLMFTATKKITDQSEINRLTQEFSTLGDGIKILEEELKKYTVGSQSYQDVQDLIVADMIKRRRVDKDRLALEKLLIESLKKKKIIEEESLIVTEDIVVAIEEQADAILTAEDATTSFSKSMIGAAINGDDMKDSLISASKSLTIQFLGDLAKRKIASLFATKVIAADAALTAAAVGSAWATPAALAATATAGGSAIAGGLALAATVAEANALALLTAAEGADFVTSGPQLMMVGEAGREKVSVTPLEGPNINGPQGGMVLNFNAPVTDRDFVRSFIIPEIQNAVRLNA